MGFLDSAGSFLGAATGQPWIGPAVGIASSLFAKKPPQYQAPGPQQMQQYLPPPMTQAPAYQSFNPNLYDVGQGQMYQGVMNQLQQINNGGSALPQGYAQTVFGNAQNQLGQANERLKRQNMETANAHGLLASGSLGEQNARTDEGYQMALGNVQSQLTQQDLAQRQNMLQLANSLEGQRYTGSYNQNQMQQNSMDLLNKYNQGTWGAQNDYNLEGAKLGQQGAQQDAQNRYASNQYGYQQGQAAQGNIFGNVQSLFSNLQAQQLRRQQQAQQAGAPGAMPQYSLRNPIAPTSLYGGFGG